MYCLPSGLFSILIIIVLDAFQSSTAAGFGSTFLLTVPAADNSRLLRILVISSLAVIVLCLFFIIFLMMRYIKALQKKETETSHLNTQRQTFIDADERLIYLKDSQLRYVFVNKAVEKFYGRPAETIIGKNDYDLTEKEFADMRRDTDKEVISKNQRMVDQVSWQGRIFKTVKFPVEMIDGTIGVGAYIEEVTEEYLSEEKIKYLSFHDELTGLYNRRFFEAELVRLDTERNLPISVIIGDVNALKLANDIFGHEAGDRLLKAAALSFKKICREDDIIARWGGDEFAILLPGTGLDQAEKISARVREHFASTTIESVEGSISLGAAVKLNSSQAMPRIMEIAEDEMYARKTLDRSDMACRLVQRIVEKIHNENPAEKAHAENVRNLCDGFARFSSMSGSAAKRLAEAAYLHDIGKVIVDSEARSGPEELENQHDEQDINMRQHPLTGFRILSFCEKTSAFAADIMQHHEHWDGTGYPKGIKGNEISHNARVISLAEAYDRMIAAGNSREKSLHNIDLEAGKRFDPDLAADFISFINKLPDSSSENS